MSWADESAAVVSGRQGERPVKFGEGLGTYYEGLVVALLGNCSTETPPGFATKERFEKALAGDHLREQFARPRRFGVTGGEPPEADVEEIVLPISPSQSPDHIYIRSGITYRAFAKYEYRICSFIQENLKLLAR
jgi:hypothetical protein